MMHPFDESTCISEEAVMLREQVVVTL